MLDRCRVEEVYLRYVRQVQGWRRCTYGMLDRCRVEEGGKMFWKFLDPGFLKRWRGEPEKSGGTTNHMLLSTCCYVIVIDMLCCYCHVDMLLWTCYCHVVVVRLLLPCCRYLLCLLLLTC